MIRTFEDIIESMKENKGERFTIYELLKTFKKECDWVGTSQQLLEILSYHLEITGIRGNNGCSACNLETLRNLSNWLEREEKVIIESKTKKPKK